MRLVHEVTADEERFRLEDTGGIHVIRRDAVQPEPVGTIMLVPVRIVGYDPDCDGSLMARFEFLALDELETEPDPEILECEYRDARAYGLSTNHGLYPTTGIVVTPEEVDRLVNSFVTHNAH
jgi:hypothetical protein